MLCAELSCYPVRETEVTLDPHTEMGVPTALALGVLLGALVCPLV